MKIAVSGIGGVGGYVGGLLARRFQDAGKVDIYFITKGENEKTIRQQGLQLQTPTDTYIVHPKLATADPALIGPVDLLIACTKSYDLSENMLQCRPCVDAATIILPLLNGVDNSRIIAATFPDNEIWDGCMYLVSRLTGPGMVQETGNIHQLFFGSAPGPDEKRTQILNLFQQAGLEATWSDNIRQIIWEKFVFISPVATLTAYLDDDIGHILADPHKKGLLHLLLAEIKSVAAGKGVSLPENITQRTIDKMAALPGTTTSSMHSDFQKHRRTELESLTGYVVRAAEELRLPVPTFVMMYRFLKTKETR